jgi:peptidoglycan/xylan/chitin deacetylase (PgdA/CDA1 family)
MPTYANAASRCPSVTIVWPSGAAAAVSFTFDLDGEEAWIGMNPANASNPVVLSQGAYGPKVAVPLLLTLLARHAVTGTFFIPGRLAERYPERVREILAAGHEVAHHGYRHLAPAGLKVEEELDELRRGREVLERLGATVTGYRAPDWNLAEGSIDRLEAEGFVYSSNFMDDVVPYRHPGLRLVELPVHWVLDDAAHLWFSDADFTKAMATNEAVASIWAAEEVGIVGLGGLCIYTCHPQVIGRPGRLGLLEQAMARAAADPDVWVAPTGEIAAHAVQVLPSG